MILLLSWKRRHLRNIKWIFPVSWYFEDRGSCNELITVSSLKRSDSWDVAHLSQFLDVFQSLHRVVRVHCPTWRGMQPEIMRIILLLLHTWRAVRFDHIHHLVSSQNGRHRRDQLWYFDMAGNSLVRLCTLHLRISRSFLSRCFLRPQRNSNLLSSLRTLLLPNHHRGYRIRNFQVALKFFQLSRHLSIQLRCLFKREFYWGFFLRKRVEVLVIIRRFFIFQYFL